MSEQNTDMLLWYKIITINSVLTVEKSHLMDKFIHNFNAVHWYVLRIYGSPMYLCVFLVEM